MGCGSFARFPDRGPMARMYTHPHSHCRREEFEKVDGFVIEFLCPINYAKLAMWYGFFRRVKK